MDDYADVCYECGAYGDDYFTNENGDLECRCPYCWIGKERGADNV